jgi:hypothetical protein
VTGVVSVFGTAKVVNSPPDPAFFVYVLESVTADGDLTFEELRTDTPVDGGFLGFWNTTPRFEGPALLRLITYDEAFNTTTSSVSLTIDHTTPTLSAFSAAPNPAPLGPVQLVLTASESLNVGASSVTVHGATVSLVSQSGQTYTYQYVVSTVTPQGTAPVAMRLVDFAGNSSVSSSSFTVDRLPPAAVSNLAASTTATAGTFSLSWTAPSDDGPTGRAAAYFVRYATYSLTQVNFGGATLASGIPTPAAPGALQSMQVTGLLSNVTYYFALRSSDTAGNLSALSNVAAAGVFTDTTPPVTSVFLTGTQFSVGGNTYISSSTTVGFSAQDETGGSGVAFTEYRLDGGSFVEYSSPFTLSEGVRMVEYRSRDNAGNMESLRQATFRVDATRPQSSLTVGTPQYNPGVGSRRPTACPAAWIASFSARGPALFKFIRRALLFLRRTACARWNTGPWTGLRTRKLFARCPWLWILRLRSPPPPSPAASSSARNPSSATHPLIWSSPRATRPSSPVLKSTTGDSRITRARSACRPDSISRNISAATAWRTSKP